MGSTAAQDNSQGAMNFFSQLAEAAETSTRAPKRVRRRRGRASKPTANGHSRALAEELADALQQQLDETLAAHDAAKQPQPEPAAADRAPLAPTPVHEDQPHAAQPAQPGAAVPHSQPQPAQPAAAVPHPTCSDPLAARYDVRNISSVELSMLGTELYQAGRISREVYAMLSFQPETHACYEQVGAQGISRPDPARQRDALAEWTAILKQQQEFGYSAYFLDQSRAVIELLGRLDRARRGI